VDFAYSIPMNIENESHGGRWWLYLILLCVAFGGTAEASDPDKPLLLHNGINSVNLDGAGLMATVMIARRDNFNAHSFEVSTFFAALKTEADSEPEMKIIPIQIEPGKEELHLTTGGGADCVLHDYRLLPAPARRTTILITADRKFGGNFADRQPVTFRYYTLTRNADGQVGNAALYFKFEKESVSKKAYCDVNEAFEAELHIPADKNQQRP
jgi:hypothetical protein